MTYEPNPAALSEVGLFQGLSSEQLSQLAPLLHESAFPAGTEVITAEEQGEVTLAQYGEHPQISPVKPFVLS